MNVIEYGEKLFDDIEIQRITKKEISSSIELNQISSSSSLSVERTVIRGVKDGKVGMYIVDSADDSKIKEGIEIAAKLARFNKPDENWNGLPGKSEYANNNVKVSEPAESDYFVKILTDALAEIKRKDPRAIVVGGESGGTWVSMHIQNSNGVDVRQKDYTSFFVMMLVRRQGDKVTPSIFDMEITKSHELDTERVINGCLDKMNNALSVKKAELTTAPVILEPFALGEILTFALNPAFNGERKVKGTSVLADKVGTQVMSEQITIADEPFHRTIPSGFVADDEGVPMQKTVLVEKGVMRGFLWNHYWAQLEGVDSTGNGLRSFRTGALSVGPINMTIEPGRTKIEDMIADMKKGYIVSSFQGAHSSNPDTGDIAVVANPAFVVEDGEIVGSTVFMLSGNVYDLMNNVNAISAETKPSFLGMMGRGVYPAIEFENVKIAAVSR